MNDPENVQLKSTTDITYSGISVDPTADAPSIANAATSPPNYNHTGTININSTNNEGNNSSISNSADNTMDKTTNRGSNDRKNHFFSDDLASQNDGPWIKGIPILSRLSLAMATILFALIGMLIGGIISTQSNPSEWVLELIYYPGNLWVRGLKLLILPLIVTIMIIVPSSLIDQVSSVGQMGSIAVRFYVFTSFCAACQGIFWGNVIQPGKQVKVSDLEDFDGSTSSDEITWWESILTIGENAIPSNVVSAMADLNILGIIVVFLTFGIILRNIINSKYGQYDEFYKQGAITIINVSKVILRCIMVVISYFIWFTPIGMLSLVTYKCASTDDLINLLEALGWYVLTAVIGQFIHMFLFYPLLYFIITQENGWLHWWRIKQAPMVAFATSSSAATLSVSLNTARVDGNVINDIANFVVPLGATINMDGTGLGFPIMVLFIAQLYDISLNFGAQISVLILSVVCSIGTAPIPSAGMVYLIMLLTVAGNGLEDDDVVTTAVATLFLIDWFIDRVETAQNVSSDQFVAKMVNHVLNLKADKKSHKICCV